MRVSAVAAAVAFAVLLGTFPGCRCSGAEPAADAGPDGAAGPAPSTGASLPSPGDGSPAEEPLEDEGDASDLAGDASTRFRDAAPKVDRDLDWPPDPVCTGVEIAFAVAVVDARCAVSAARAKKLRALLERDGGRPPGLRQEAKLAPDGRVTLRLVNKSGTSLSLPLSFHGKLPVFSVLAEDAQHTLYELASPELDLRDRGEGSRSHFARIVLSPEAVATATFAVSPTILRVLGRGATDPCRTTDAGDCSATKLGKGHYILHVGELLTDVEGGPPARVEIDLP